MASAQGANAQNVPGAPGPEAEILPRDVRQVLIAHNPRAGSKARRRQLDQLSDELRRRDLVPQIFADLDELEAAAQSSAEAGKLRAVLAAGGDGTVAEVVNRLSARIPIAPYPMGTENLLARYLHCSRGIEATARRLTEGITVRLDAGKANGRLFVLMIGIGFDAEVVRRVAAARSGHITRFSYAKPLLTAFRKYAYPELHVHYGPDGATKAARIAARWVFGVNLPKYALGLNFTPAAEGADGLLDVCTFQRGSFLDAVRYLGYLLTRRHTRLEDVSITRCATMRVETDSQSSVPYQLDGDHGGVLPVDVQMLPQRFLAVVGRRTARRLGFRLPPGTDR